MYSLANFMIKLLYKVAKMVVPLVHSLKENSMGKKYLAG
jgi:hypothetical protein